MHRDTYLMLLDRMIGPLWLYAGMLIDRLIEPTFRLLPRFTFPRYVYYRVTSPALTVAGQK
jgi:hypothetical protein